MDDSLGEVESCLIDLSNVDLENLSMIDGSVLANACQRIRTEAARSEEVVAGFNSSL